MWQEILFVLLGILLGGLLAFLLMGWCMFRRAWARFNGL